MVHKRKVLSNLFLSVGKRPEKKAVNQGQGRNGDVLYNEYLMCSCKKIYVAFLLSYIKILGLNLVKVALGKGFRPLGHLACKLFSLFHNKFFTTPDGEGNGIS